MNGGGEVGGMKEFGGFRAAGTSGVRPELALSKSVRPRVEIFSLFFSCSIGWGSHTHNLFFFLLLMNLQMALGVGRVKGRDEP